MLQSKLSLSSFKAKPHIRREWSVVYDMIYVDEDENENANGGTENIEDIGVEDVDFNGIESIRLSMNFRDNSQSGSPSASRAKIRRVKEV
ncbi:hypothetical protein V6N13_096822 [Hibiscus sabdariffa]